MRFGLAVLFSLRAATIASPQTAAWSGGVQWQAPASCPTQADETDDEQGTTTTVTTSEETSASGSPHGTTSADDGPVLECEGDPTPYPCSSDADGDDIPLACDNAPYVFNPSQFDLDGDGITAVEDLCPTVASDAANAADSDEDGIGNACDSCPSTT